MSQLESSDGRDTAIAMIGAAFAAILSLGTGPAAPVVGPLITPPITTLVARAAAEWRRKSNVVADAALVVSAITDSEAFCERLAGDPDMIALTQKVLFAATVTGKDGKLRALGAVLGRAAAGHRIDETNLLIDALAAVEDSHVNVMAVIARDAPEDRPGWLTRQVQAEVDLEPELVLAVLSTLARHGLADTDRDNYGSVDQFRLTKFGHLLMDIIRQAASEPTSQNGGGPR